MEEATIRPGYTVPTETDGTPADYSAIEAAQEKAHREAQQRQEVLDKLPETLEALKNENEMLKQCLLEMSETVYA